MKFGVLINHSQGGPGWVLNGVKAMPRGKTPHHFIYHF